MFQDTWDLWWALWTGQVEWSLAESLHVHTAVHLDNEVSLRPNVFKSYDPCRGPRLSSPYEEHIAQHRLPSPLEYAGTVTRKQI